MSTIIHTNEASTLDLRLLLDGMTALKQGDFHASLPRDWSGLPGKIADAFNDVVQLNRSMSEELERLNREVGREGKIHQRAHMKGFSGAWAGMVNSANALVEELVRPTSEMSRVIGAVAKGDLSQSAALEANGRPLEGEFLMTARTVNTMVDLLSSFSSEVTRVAREVGTEGKLGGQAVVPGVAGTWKDLTDNVNFMASNLTGQVRNIAEVTIAVANGDLSKKITVDVRGEILQLKETINTMVDQLRSFASEVTRVAREVGTEGKLGGQAAVPGVAGTWKDLTDNVNLMANNLTGQVRNIAEVTTAVAKGDLSKKITVDVKGEILALKDTVNTMVDQLSSFASEVTRVAREVGTEGKLGGQAAVPGVAGTWKDLTDNVNLMANNLTGQVRNIAEVTTAVAKGDLSKKIAVDVKGEILELKDTINTMVDQLRSFASEVTRVAREVGTEGKLGGQAAVPGVAGTWKDLTDNVNLMANNLTGQVRNIAEVTTAVAKGDLSKKITVDVKGEILALKDTVNTMVDQLNSFAGEVTRVAREVGTEGKLGGQAQVKGVSGTWKDLTDNVNLMAANLTDQVRGIAKVVTAVANGDVNKKLSVVAKGEIAALADTINGMIDTLATFAAQVTSVAREVGVEGHLGGQANVPGAAGTWKDLTDNVNRLAANLTTQVRAIAEVATAVTKGDLTRSIRVDARGEVETLKDTINQMIANLRATTQKNADQDWLKTNLTRFTRMLQGQRDLQTVSSAILTELSKVVEAQHGAFYIAEEVDGEARMRMLSAFAYQPRPDLAREFALGEGLVGQCARDKERLLLKDPPQDYIRISSGLGEHSPSSIVVLPILFENQMKAVLELASFSEFSDTHVAFLEQLMEGIGIVLNTLEAKQRTEALLESLQNQQEALRTTNQALEEKADQLALTSKYKSEFLSNMSHELRTPLNSMLILSQQLAEDSKNLTEKQIEYARTIHTSGGDLLALINDILDLSKVESGTMTLEVDDVPFTETQRHLERVFRHLADSKGLRFGVEFEPNTPAQIHTDGKRVEQVLRNLLSNAFKFTEKGQVSLRVAPAASGWTPDHPVLSQADAVIAFTVSDTGIGIPREKQKIIFEAFQQAESGTSRKYGGTGLGLSISRELAKLLGGQLSLASSVPGKGSTFVLYLPKTFTPPPGGSEKAMLLAPPKMPRANGRPEQGGQTEPISDDRKDIQPGDKVLLIVEDDPAFARVLLEAAHKAGFKGLVAQQGGRALELIAERLPDAVTLDIHLPDMEGWRVLAALKNDLRTRHVPVQVVSLDDDRYRAIKDGALGFLAKPAARQELNRALQSLASFHARPARSLLLLSAQSNPRRNLAEALQGRELKLTVAKSSSEALNALQDARFDCMVMELPSKEGQEVLLALGKDPLWADLPVVVHRRGDLSKAEEALLKRASRNSVICEVRSMERLVDEAAFYLHLPVATLPEKARHLVEELHGAAALLAGKRALVVDDDIRNIFAMTSLLEHHQMSVLSAESGKDAMRLLSLHPDLDVVLMDIMMPEMDGYDTMKAIRQDPRFKSLPIIALTAKAMKGDREKCIEMGASDYITKPVDSEQLLSLMRLWLRR
jgi:HAMP domain-containing protein/signal transduction histidine kinase/DNA-binding response OmpR family regulator